MAIEDKNGCLHSEKDGKFVCKNKPYDSQENKAQVLARRVNSKYDNMSAKELSEELKQELPNKANRINLTPQEWALWYKAVAENKKLGYWANELDNGSVLLKIENDKSNKLVVTSGTFEKPIAQAVYEFEDVDEMNDFIMYYKELL